MWDEHPARGPAPAADASTGTLFKLYRRYAERFGDAWVILSAKYGLIAPAFVIPGPYDTAFGERHIGAVGPATLRHQVETLGLLRYE